MTRKDHIKIAAMIAEIRTEQNESFVAQYVLDIVETRLSYILRADNPRFDAERFHEACEVQQ